MKGLSLVALIALLAIYINSMDLQSAEKEEQLYLEMVCNGIWPDFKGLAKGEKACVTQ